MHDWDNYPGDYEARNYYVPTPPSTNVKIPESKSMLKKVISGGQTGADEGGLIAGRKAGYEVSGYIPKGFLTENGPNPDLGRTYNLIETDSSSYVPRTYANAKWGEGTIRFASDFASRGEIATLDGIKKAKRTHIDVDINNPIPVEDVVKWLKENKIEILNIAGNRESVSPGICEFVVSYLEKVFKQLNNT